MQSYADILKNMFIYIYISYLNHSNALTLIKVKGNNTIQHTYCIFIN